jgi:hypothetical protein
MGSDEYDEPTELELEQQRAGYTPQDSGDLFDQVRAATWLPSWARRRHGDASENSAQDEFAPGDDPDGDGT